MNDLTIKTKMRCGAPYCRVKLKLTAVLREDLEISSVPSSIGTLVEISRQDIEKAKWTRDRHFGWLCPAHTATPP